MNIFLQIKNSVYGREYYQSVVLNESTGKSIKYLAKLSLLIALFGSIILGFSLPTFNNKLKNGISNFVTNYPEDLIISLKDGNASINRQEPFMVKIPDSWKGDSDIKSAKIDNIMVIDTTKPFSLDTFGGYSTFSLLTKTELITKQGTNGEMKILPLSKFGSFELTKTWLLDKEVIVMKILPWAILAILPFAYIGIFIGVFIGSLIISLIYALIVWIIFKVKKVDLTYKKSYQVALHASTILVILGMFSTYVSFLDNFFFKLLILIVVVIVNFPENFLSVKSKEPILASENIEIKE